MNVMCGKCGAEDDHAIAVGYDFWCRDCFWEMPKNEPQAPVPPTHVNALLSDLSRRMSDVGYQIQLSIASMPDAASADVLAALLGDFANAIQKLNDMAETRREKLRG